MVDFILSRSNRIPSVIVIEPLSSSKSVQQADKATVHNHFTYMFNIRLVFKHVAAGIMSVLMSSKEPHDLHVINTNDLPPF